MRETNRKTSREREREKQTNRQIDRKQADVADGLIGEREREREMPSRWSC